MFVPCHRSTAALPTGSRSSSTTASVGRAAAPKTLQRKAERHPRLPFRLGVTRARRAAGEILHQMDLVSALAGLLDVVGYTH